MALADDIKTQVETIIDTIFGSDFTKTTYTEGYDKWGDGTVTITGTSLIKGVYAQKFPLRTVQDPYGKINEGSIKFYSKTADEVFPGSVIINDGSYDYDVMETKQIGFADVNIVNVSVLDKRLESE